MRRRTYAISDSARWPDESQNRYVYRISLAEKSRLRAPSGLPALRGYSSCSSRKISPCHGKIARPRHPLRQNAEELLLRLRPEQSRWHAPEFTLDEDRQTFVCHFRLSKRYTGPPGHCHGGIIATILDDAMGKVNKLHHVVALTKEMTVEYLKPVPLHKPLRVEGREVSVHGRQHINAAEILNRRRMKSSRAAGESSSPSTPKKCSGSSWNDS